MPEMPGSIQSRMMRSGRSSVISSGTSSPLVAVRGLESLGFEIVGEKHLERLLVLHDQD